jgi:hypothetical protein
MQHGVGEQFLEGGLGTGAGLSRLQEQPLSPARDDAGASRGAARRADIQRNEAV